MESQKIKLYKRRDFSQKISITIDYIRENFAGLIKAMLIIIIPFGLLYALVMSSFFGAFGEMVQNPNQNPVMSTGAFAGIGMSYLVMIISMLVAYALIIASIYTYIKEKDQGNVYQPVELIKRSAGKVPGIIGLLILTGLVSLIGMLLFILPGIYLAVALSIAIPVYVFEGVSVGAAFTKSFKLINGKWWSTFGLLFITGLIAGVISYIFAIPMYILMFGEMFANQEALVSNPESVYEIFTSWYSSLSMALVMVGSFCTYMIPMIALSFQYFNLSERKEGTGLKQQIQDFENL